MPPWFSRSLFRAVCRVTRQTKTDTDADRHRPPNTTQQQASSLFTSCFSTTKALVLPALPSALFLCQTQPRSAETRSLPQPQQTDRLRLDRLDLTTLEASSSPPPPRPSHTSSHPDSIARPPALPCYARRERELCEQSAAPAKLRRSQVCRRVPRSNRPLSSGRVVARRAA